MSNFSWKIQHVDLESRSMVVEYKKDGVAKTLNIPMPEKTEDVNATIHSYSPQWFWEQAKKPVATVFAGMTGAGFAVVEPEPLDSIKESAKGKINQYREMIIEAGVRYKNHQFNSTEQTINRLTAVITSAQSGIPLPADFAWRTTTNEMISMTLSELCELLKEMTQKISDTFAISWDKKRQIDAATTEEEVGAVTWVDSALGVRV
ncbi:Domain of unknown function DUF4376 [uncultured Caudovirales phage]|uniref:DUF4376 domain-containing protein n=1 Tax=uncultured Caudovirales phage TaxID=2100421 RepID=A0A6J5L4U4_9CAUD|nr:Domain of unknown function DUF4376 [uncultured Caudovirales phage]